MVFTYVERELEGNNWMTIQEDKINSIHEIACLAVFHDLNNGYFENIDGRSDRTMEQDNDGCMWSQDCLYPQDEVFRMCMEGGSRYILGYIYVTKGFNPRIVVVAYVVPEGVDFWDDEKVKVLSNLETKYFMVEY